MGVGIGRTVGHKTAADIVMGVYPEFALIRRVIGFLVKGAMTQKEVGAGSFETPCVGGDKGGDGVGSFDGFNECGHKLSIGWLAGLTVNPIDAIL